jgi:hypothetical protein
MEDKDRPDGSVTGFDEMLKAIKAELKAGLDSVKTELKADLKAELDSIRNEMRREAEGNKGREAPFWSAPHGGRTPPSGDFASSEMPGKGARQRTEEFSLTDFDGIEIGGGFEAEIIRSDACAVSVTAEDELFRNLDVSKDGGTLRIRHSRHIGWRAQLSRPRIKVTLPTIRELRLSGATRATITGFSSSEKITMEMSGASSISGDIVAGDADLQLSGASRARLTGSARDIVLEASGANHAELGGFSLQNAAVKLSGATHVTLKMDGRLDAKLSGVSHLSLFGNPVMGNIRTTGASRITKE